MKKLLMGLTAVFALTVAVPAFAGDDAPAPAPAKEKKGKSKKAPPKKEETKPADATK